MPAWRRSMTGPAMRSPRQRMVARWWSRSLSPTAATGGTPTGTVFNGGSGFKGDRFLFATEEGTIAGWNPAVNRTRARIEVDRSTVGLGAVYKGLAIGNNGVADHIYTSNFRFGTIEVFDSSYAMVTLSGSFSDPGIPAGFAPFNIKNLGGVLYVTYAMQKPDKHDDQSGPGFGFVDAYDLNGQLLRRVASGGALNSPWGLAIAPASFGNFHNNLLVGNFGDGRINAYNLATGAFRGQLKRETSAPIENPGPLGPAVRQRRRRREPEYALLHGRHQRRGGWPVRQHRQRR